MKGIKTNFFIDVKTDIKAGKQFSKIKKIGYKVTRLYYDNDVMDYQVGSEEIRRVIK